jgi:pimeloyl-ACP methyl ester carboxylesterase
MVSKSLSVQGVAMRWEEEGEGFPIVLVHGIPTSPALWRHVVPRLHGRSMAWEMVGYGQSIRQGEGRDLSVARQAEYLLAWLDGVGVEQAVFVGHDLGGGVLQIAASHARERFAGLVLTNSIAYDSWPIPSVKAMRAMGGLVSRAPDALLRAIISVLIWRGHDDRGRMAESRDLHLEPYERHGGTPALVRQVRSLDVHDTLAVQDQLSEIGVPAQIVWGAADQFQKLRYGERLARDLDAPLHRIEGGKHFTPEDHPDEIARAVNELVRLVDAGV